MNIILSLINNGSSDEFVIIVDTNKINSKYLVSMLESKIPHRTICISRHADDDEVCEDPSGIYKEILDAEVQLPCYVEGMDEIFYE